MVKEIVEGRFTAIPLGQKTNSQPLSETVTKSMRKMEVIREREELKMLRQVMTAEEEQEMATKTAQCRAVSAERKVERAATAAGKQ
jgi:hypothetical protein